MNGIGKGASALTFGIALAVSPQYFQQKEEKRRNESLKSREKEMFVTRVIGVLFIILGLFQLFEL